MMDADKKRIKAIQKELQAVRKREQKLQKAFVKAKNPAWKTVLGDKIPQKVYFGLESTFCKGFSLVFNQRKTPENGSPGS